MLAGKNRYIGKVHVSEVVIVYLSYSLRVLSFLIITPILSRRLSTSEWGVLLSAQALGVWLTLLIEYGFTISLPKIFVTVSGQYDKVRMIIGDVFSAKIALSILAICIGFTTIYFGALHKHKEVVFWTILWAICQGFSPIWYFQATNRLKVFSIIDIVTRIFFIMFVISLIHGKDQSSYVMLLQFISAFMSTLIACFILIKEIGGLKLSIEGASRAVREGFRLSIFTFVTSIYTTLGIFLFGVFSNPMQVGIYGNADRLVKTSLSIFAPLNQIILPRSVKAFAESPLEGKFFFIKVLKVYTLLGFLIGLVLFFCASKLIVIFYGKAYFGSIEILRILAILVPLVAINTVITYHFLIPNKFEKYMNKVYIFASLSALIGIFVLVPIFKFHGMLIASILPEAIVSLLLINKARKYIFNI